MAAVMKAGAIYFAVAFAFGFVFGVIRTLWLVPAVGERAAELIEMPLMLVVIVFAARTIVRRHREMRAGQWVAVGFLALALLLAVEFTAVLRLRGLSLPEYFAARDPVSGTAYYVMLVVFAALPCLMFRQRDRGRDVTGI